MIPFLGDGSGIIKELYNLHMTGEMDELNLTLSVIGLAMDLPFDGGILGDTAVATLKAASTMIPSGPAREILLESLQQVGKNPEGLIAMAGAFGKMMGNEDLLKIVTSNPEVFKAYLNGGAEAAENLLKYEDEIIQAGKAIGADELIDIMEGGKATIKSADDVAEVGAKAVASSADEIAEETVSYYRVQGGQPPNASQYRIITDENSKLLIPNKEANLNVSANTRDHAEYFLELRGDGAEIVEVEVPQWFDDFVQENAIPQYKYNSNPLNQGGIAPKIVDPMTPGNSYELPSPWIEWLEEYGVMK